MKRALKYIAIYVGLGIATVALVVIVAAVVIRLWMLILGQ